MKPRSTYPKRVYWRARPSVNFPGLWSVTVPGHCLLSELRGVTESEARAYAADRNRHGAKYGVYGPQQEVGTP